MISKKKKSVHRKQSTIHLNKVEASFLFNNQEEKDIKSRIKAISSSEVIR